MHNIALNTYAVVFNFSMLKVITKNITFLSDGLYFYSHCTSVQLTQIIICFLVSRSVYR